MKHVSSRVGLFLMLSSICRSQPAPAPFEAADVHVSPAGATTSGGFLPNASLEFRATTLLRLISLAYSLPPDRIAGGPSWLDSDRFDVVAKAKPGTAQPALRTMLQGLLAERFGLSVQMQEKAQPVLALVVARKGAQKPAGDSGEPGCKSNNEDNVRTLSCHQVSLGSLAESLPQLAPAYFNRPTVDRTGLTGKYDFTLQFLPRGQIPPGADNHPLHLFTSLEKQLGVKVENQTAPVPVLAVERVNREPSPNPPGVSEKLGAPPTEFEVADIHRSRPGAQQDVDVKNGRITATALSLRELIAFAFDVEEDWVKGGEKWIDSDRFDIVAKSSPTASVDTLRTMLQALLADRFRMKVHKEPQPVTVFALTAVKPKLKDADPATRSACRISLAEGTRAYTCQNTTMAQFAEKLRSVGAMYLDHPVVDLTGLKGAYEFTLNWTPRNNLQTNSERAAAEAGATSAGAVPVATDRPVGYTLFEAIDRQLGLKLAAQKYPMPVIVVDHVDRTPTEN